MHVSHITFQDANENGDPDPGEVPVATLTDSLAFASSPCFIRAWVA